MSEIKMSRGFEIGDEVLYDNIKCIIIKFINVNTVILNSIDSKTWDRSKISIDNLIPTSNKFLNVFHLYTNIGEEIYKNDFSTIKTCKEIRTFFKRMIDNFNDTLREEEKPRKFIRVKREVKINGKIKLVKV